MLFENMHAGCVIYDAVGEAEDFVIAAINKSGLKHTGLKREDLIGKRVTEVFPGIREMGLFEVFQRVWRTGKPEDLPQAAYVDNRLNDWLENHIFKLPSGQIVASYNDITDRKRAEDELLSSNIFLDSVIDQSPFPMLIVDLHRVRECVDR